MVYNENTGNMTKFRFEDLEIWKFAIDLGLSIMETADEMDERKFWRFADQTRGVAMSISNNIAESTGTNRIGEQQQLLRYARRECFEAANIVILLHKKDLISESKKDQIKSSLSILSRKIYNYSNSLEKL